VIQYRMCMCLIVAVFEWSDLCCVTRPESQITPSRLTSLSPSLPPPLSTNRKRTQAVLVLFDLPDFMIISAYVLLALVWAEAFIQSRSHWLSVKQFRRCVRACVRALRLLRAMLRGWQVGWLVIWRACHSAGRGEPGVPHVNE
jgi:hypothetical protein